MKKTLLTTLILVLFFCTAHSAGFRDYDEETAPVGTDLLVMQQGDNSATNFLTFANLATNYLATLYEPLKGPDDNFVTDAEKVVIGNTSGINTGDETSTTIIAEFNSGSCSGYLKSDGNCDTPAGGGNVSKVGTPVNNQVGVWTGDGTIEGDPDLTFDGTDFSAPSFVSTAADTYRGVTFTENTADTNVDNQSIHYTANVLNWKNESGVNKVIAFDEVISGSEALATASIAANSCATVATDTATGVTTSDVIEWGFNTRISQVAGYGVTSAGSLRIDVYPTANAVNIEVCNPTDTAIVPGALTILWEVD